MKTYSKLFLLGMTVLLSSITSVFAAGDATISSITLHDGGTDVAVYANPIIDITIANEGTDAINETNLGAGFIRCEAERGGATETVFSSDEVGIFTIQPGLSLVAANLKLSNIITQVEGQVPVTCSITLPGDTNNSNDSASITLNIQKGKRFDSSMNKAIAPIKTQLDASPALSNLGGGDTIKNFIFTKVVDILIPILMVFGIFVALIGFYKIMFSDGDDAVKDGTKYIIYGVIGILLVMSAKYIATVLFADILGSGAMATGSAITAGAQGVEFAKQLYEKIAYPFLKIAIYLVLGFMFVVLLLRVFSFFTAGDDSAKKKAGTIITWNIVGMMIIIGGKQLIEAVYGKKEAVLNQNAQNLGEIGSAVLADKTIPLLYQVINWVMGLAAFAVLVLIIFQTVQLLMKPDDANALGKMKKSIIYILIGVVVIGAGYVLTNFLIIN